MSIKDDQFNEWKDLIHGTYYNNLYMISHESSQLSVVEIGAVHTILPKQLRATRNGRTFTPNHGPNTRRKNRAAIN